jgi:tRNA pseudouridine32 synthase/23S rRNA pseudouridine746 synthase
VSALSDDLRLRVLCEAGSFVAIEKPSGLLSVPGKGEEKKDCVVARVRAMFPRAVGPMVVHRLDMETSGILLVGLTVEGQRELSRQFEQREVEKRYVAVLEGQPSRDEGVIDLPMRADIENRPRQVVDFVQGRPAQTRYRVLGREPDRARVEFEPITGRSHQLRVHASAARVVRAGADGLLCAEGVERPGGLGCAIVGDVLYGRGMEEPGQRLLLHASWIAFTDPETGRRVEVECRAGF